MSMQIANTILEQLGGRRFIAMTGAKNFVAIEDGLQFDLPRTPHFVRNGINKIRIHLDPTNTYTMKGLKRHRFDADLVKEESGLYWDMLQPAFTEFTGLDTYL